MRKAYIPEFWITTELKGDALRTLFAVALHADKRGYCVVKNDTLAAMLGKDVRRVQADINRGELLGLISRKFDEKGKRYFVVNMTKRTDDEKQHPMTENDVTENNTPCRKTTGGDDELQQGGMTNYNTPPNNPHIGTLYSNTVLQHRQTEEPQAPDGESVSVSNASLPPPQPKQEAPPDVIRMATQLQLETWIGQVQFQNISLSDWRVKETLARLHVKGGSKNANYAWGIFRKLPEQKPVVPAESYSPTVQAPMPNVMPPKHQPDSYERIFTEYSNKIAAAKWPIEAKGFCLDRLDTVERTGSAESYRAKLQSIFERAAS